MMRKLLDRMVDLVRTGELGLFTRRAHDFEPADLAEVLTALDEKQRVSAVQALPPELSSQALAEMPEEAHAGETLAALDPDLAAEIVDELDDDDAADILGNLDPSRQEQILAAVEDRSEVEQLLRYDEESAGGLMTTHMVTVPVTATAGEALEEIRRQSEEVEDFYQVFVVDADRRLVGILPFKDLVISRPDRPVRSFMEDADIFVTPELDQEEVARLMARYNLPSVPVVNEQRQLLGRVTFDDVIDVVEAETTEDMLRFGGVSADEELGAGWETAVRSRLPWLSVNLLTAFLAGGVVYLFQHTIQHTVALAVWMPIIAGMGGNAGTQALAVTVRRLALGLIPVHLFARVVGKEILVGITNGIVMGLAVGTVAALIGEGPKLGVVVFLAMTGNLMVAGFAGAFIPILLERLGADPAVASSIFVTTFTDVCGFLLLLGLAGTLLL
ncbi:MAG TPA: magnesium transporter [Gemmatimonadales bacterium]|jgi:magnesium transporter|nr:magnesium transporter [Gemmatimonadales bacterium]